MLIIKAQSTLPTDFGISAIKQFLTVRFYSECIMGEVIHSRECKYG